MKKLFFQKISTILVILKVRGIVTSNYELNEFDFAAFYILSLNRRGGLEVYVYIRYALHLIEGLKANVLIGNNVFYIKSFTINLINASADILEDQISIDITTKTHSQFLRYNILTNTTIFVLSESKVLILFWQIALSDLQDFLFYLHPQ